MNVFENYHNHKYWTNIIVADSPCGYKEYIDRVLELGHTVVSSVEHGYQGNYFLLNEMVRKKNMEFMKRRLKGEKNVPKDLKFIFGTEAYFVKNRLENDKSNCHLVILAKNDKGRRAINMALSIANEDGMFNGRARLDMELILGLPKDDVFLTTACLGYWSRYDDIEDITLQFYNHFKDNFLLEVQNHDTNKQKEINQRILKLHEEHGIELIAGMDSHFINEAELRRGQILKYKNLFYPEEEGWYLDYPDYDTAFERFVLQGVLSTEQIENAFKNTLLLQSFEDIDLGLKTIVDYNNTYIENGITLPNIYLDAKIKLPSMHNYLTQKGKDDLLKQIINEEWCKFKELENIPPSEYEMYLEGIRYEVGEVVATGMADYFLIHYYGLKKGKENGGRITKRGRGSAVGFFINTLLGFSKVDRFKSPIKIYPERFLTADRILKSKGIPDIDSNVDEQEPFVKAFEEMMGENSIYPMIAYGALKKSSAIKLYMGAEGIESPIQNEVSKHLKEYDKAVKYCETDEEKEQIDIRKYVQGQYVKYIDLSKPYQNIIIQKSAHPCAFMLFDGDIREEIGLIRCESETTGKSVLTTVIDGTMADHYKYLKTDLLIVDVVGLTEDIWTRVGKPSITNTQLEVLLASEEGSKAWDIYAEGLTMCINQCEQEGTRTKCKKYKMTNTAELSAFVAGVRPAFGSLLQNFLNRLPYTTGVPELDEVLKDSYHYMLYQESLMAYLGWLGVDMKETYDVIKKIGKKSFAEGELEELQIRCREHWIKNVGNDDGFKKTWDVMEDATAYAFNSAHSYCVGNDGAEIAYLKAYYPYETYEVCLNRFDAKKNKDKVSALKQEMKHFGILEGKLRFGLDNRKFTLDKENNCIHPSLSSIKKIGVKVAEELFEIGKVKYNNFLEVIEAVKTQTSVNNTVLEMLVKLDYFIEYGSSQKILDMVKYYDLLAKAKSPKKSTIRAKTDDDNVISIIEKNSTPTTATYTKFQAKPCLEELWNTIPNKPIPLHSNIINRREILGFSDYINTDLDKRYIIVESLDTKYSPIVDTYSLGSGVQIKCKINKKLFKENPIDINSIIYIHSMEPKFPQKKVGEKILKNGNIKPLFEEDTTRPKVWWITNYSVITNLDEALEG